MSKLIPHVINLTGPVQAWMDRAPSFKRLDGPGPIVRKYWPDSEMNSRIQGMAVQRTFDDIMALGPTEWVVIFNEVAQKLGQGLEAHADFTEKITPMFQAKGLKVAGFSFSTGNPEFAELNYLHGRNWCGVDALDFHCYFGTTGFDEYYALRYRMLDPWPHPPVIIGETGIDAVPGGASGWKNTGYSGAQYLDLLSAYDAELAKDAYVLYAAVFTGGPTPDWEAFSTDGLDMSRFYGGAPVSEPIADLQTQVGKFAEIMRSTLKGDWDTARIQLDALDPNDAGKWTNAIPQLVSPPKA